MGLSEKTPLRGSEEHVPYVFMTDPNRAYKKKVRQLQCYLCSGIIAVFALALLVSVAYSVDMENEDETPTNGSLSLSLKASPKSDVSEFMKSANDYIIRAGYESNSRKTNLRSDDENALYMDSTHLGKASGKANVSKKATNFIVNIANVTASIGEDIIYESYYQKFPIELPLDNVADTSAYTPSADVTFSSTYDDDILEGTASIPLKNTGSFQKKQKEILQLNFIAGVTIKWSGSFDFVPKKDYKCKLMFQSYAKLSGSSSVEAIKMASDNSVVPNDGEQCNIFLIGTYYHRPFYCPITPWWCSEGMIFYWSGEAKLIFTKPLPPAAPETLKNMINTPTLKKLTFASDAPGMNIQIMKSFVGLKVNSGQITWQTSGNATTNSLSVSPPMNINLTNLQSPNSVGKGIEISLRANQIGDTIVDGIFTVPIFTVEDGSIGSGTLSGTYSFNVVYTNRGAISVNNENGSAVDPNKEYKCILIFQGSKKASANNKQSSPIGESCFLKVSGSFTANNAFLWSGDVELILSYKSNGTTVNSAAAISKQFQLGNSPEVMKSSIAPGSFPVNIQVMKSITAVEVISGQISLQNIGEDTTSTFSVSPPISINVTNLRNPNSIDKSMNITFKANQMGDTMISGIFTIPTYTNINGFVSTVPLKGSFSLNVVYTSRSTINVDNVDGPTVVDGSAIDPTKEYTCKLIFQGSKKISMISEQSPLFGESCSLKINGSFAGSNTFLWSGNIELILYSKNIDNPYVPIATSKQLQMGSPPAVMKSSLGPGLFPVNIQVMKSFTGVKVITGQISLQNIGDGTTNTLSVSPPITINVTSLRNPNAIDKSMSIIFKANQIGETIINGIFTVPTYENVNGIINEMPLKGSFSLNVVYTNGGTINVDNVDGPTIVNGSAIDPTKEYTCKLILQGSKKISMINKQSPLFGEMCTLKVSGSYAGGDAFLWSGNIELILNSKNIDNPYIPIGNSKQLQMGSPPTVMKSSLGPGLFPVNIQVMKSFTGIKVITGQISLQNIGGDTTNTLSVSPPITINVTSLRNPNAIDKSMSIIFKANQIGETIINGIFTVPTYENVNGIINEKPLKGSFSLNVVYTNGGTINVDNVDGPTIVNGSAIDPTKEYTCKLILQGSKKISMINKQSPLFGEMCTLKVSGFYAGGDAFLWSGNIELILNSKNIDNPYIPIGNSKQFVLNMPIEQPSPSNVPNRLGKTENFVITKTFASVTVLKGKVTGQFNGEEAMTVLDGSPPVDFYLDNFINPNSFDVSLQATWQATPVEDSRIVGTFSIPYFPTLGDTTDRRKFTANFTVDIIYKYGGSIGIIDPSKTYSCKVMFQGNKKLSANDLSSASEESRPVLTKTPFGESCTITISGSFYEPSVFCHLTPWWCSKGKIFHWSGDIELALKNKQNITNADEDGNNNLKKSAALLPKTFILNADNSLDSGERNIQDYVYSGHRLGGRVLSGWIKTNNGGIFSGSTTVWSGELPFEIKFPIFWTPTNDDGSELSSVYSHAILWSASIFHSTVQGSFSFPQYVGHGPPPNLKWISGTFSFQLQPDSKISLYDLIVPGMKYNSNLHYHNLNSPDNVQFVNPTKRDPVQEDITYGIRAPIILLGKYASGGKSFIWNGTFIIDVSKTAKDLTYG